MVNIEYLYNPDSVRKRFEKNYFIDKKLGFRVIENGTILPYRKTINGKTNDDGWGFGGIVDDKGEFIQGSHVHYGINGAYTPPPHKILDTAPKLLSISVCFTVLGDMS